MVSAIGSPPSPSTGSTTAASKAGIEAQIARDKKELSNCVNCEPANTKQGQADIQALSNKIAVAEARLENTTTSKQDSQPTESSATTANNTPANSHAVASIAENITSTESATTPKSSDSTTGRLVDVFA